MALSYLAPCRVTLQQLRDLVEAFLLCHLYHAATVGMPRGHLSAMRQQHAHGLRLPLAHHARQRSLPVLRLRFTRQALGKWTLQRLRVAREYVGNPVQTIEF